MDGLVGSGKRNMDKRRRANSAAWMILGVALLIAVIVGAAWKMSHAADDTNQFAVLMSSGKTYLDKGESGKAIEAFQRAVAMNPNNPDVHLNLANAFLKANGPEQAVRHADEVLNYDAGSAAAHYLKGCAFLRLSQFTNAVQALQTAQSIDQTVNAVAYQLGRAHAGLGQWAEAAKQFEDITQFERDTNAPIYLSAYYQLSQSLLRQGRTDDAKAALAEHQRVNAGRQTAADSPSLYERCAYTEARAPFAVEQPAERGESVRFADITSTALGTSASGLSGPIGLFDLNRRGVGDLLVKQGDGFVLLWNSNATFSAQSDPMPALAGNVYQRCLVGDIHAGDQGRYEDALLIGEKGLQIFRFATNGFMTDATQFAGMRQQAAVDAVVADLDFTGKLGLLTVTSEGKLRSFRNLGNGAFRDNTVTSGIPANITGVSRVMVHDWNNDDLPDVILSRRGQSPLLLLNQRGGGFVVTNQPPDWPVSEVVAFGDLNNDLRADVVIAGPKSLTVFYGGLKEPRQLAARGNRIAEIRLMDYDNDGWLDIIAWGQDGIWSWRNKGRTGFHETRAELGLGTLVTGPVKHLATGDFDCDGDLDLVFDQEGAGLRVLRNDGGNANGMVKLRLLGNRSNASGLGVKIELASGLFHAMRQVDRLPIAIGVGKRSKLDAITVRWFDTQGINSDVEVDKCQTWSLVELTTPGGSCPYLYASNGETNRFVTDLLGAAPIGLPIAQGRYIDADPEEFVKIGDDSNFQPRNGAYELRITEELREVLYLDEARMHVVDHPVGTEVHATSKLLPGKPWIPHRLVQLSRQVPLRGAKDHEGVDVTDRLLRIDGAKVSPSRLRDPQFRGLAEPHGVILDFGPLQTDRPLTLALTGWLRFGGGMANVAASHNPEFPFPFPTLEVETSSGQWSPVDVRFGAPAGKTKTIVVDLAGKLPEGARRLKLSQAFEIHWDRIALFEASEPVKSTYQAGPDSTQLQPRGYSEFAQLPWHEPLTPIYSQLLPRPRWRMNVSGWVTRYGAVDELIAAKDDTLALIAGGDELVLRFDGKKLPPRREGMVREYFLWTVGWDKDADYHVAEGHRVEPLPWHGMEDQHYGHEVRPPRSGDELHARYNTRWVGPFTFGKRAASPNRTTR